MTKEIEISIREVRMEDHPVLENIRIEAFSPIFVSFRQILGDEIYETAQKKEDEEQSDVLSAMFSDDSKWLLYVAETNHDIVGFVSFNINKETGVGEIGLNAVRPSHSGKGIGTKMYDFAVSEMIAAGMKVAVVATGGDDSHIPARKAYIKSGFNVSIPSIWMCRTL